MAPFITFEGIEGSGKTTQIKRAGAYLKQHGIPLILTEEPGGTVFGRKIRSLLLNRKSYTISAEAELMMFLSARAQHVRQVIKPALEKQKVVLCDRFCDATLAYQGYGRGLPLKVIEEMDAFARASLKPSKTFLFDMAPETGLQRAMSRIAQIDDRAPKEDRFEQEHIAFHKRVRDGYLEIAHADPERFIIIDASKDIDAVYDDLMLSLLPLVEERS